ASSMTDLTVRGGTVVTVDGSRRADVAVEGGRVVAIGPDLGMDAREVVDASGLLVLPGIVDVHTHTRIASDAEPDRFFRDSVAAAFGGTTTFLAFNNPGTGGSAASGRSLMAGLTEWRDRTAGDSAVDYAVSLVVTSGQDDPVAEMPAAVAAGVPTFKAFMVYDFGVDDRTLLRALAAAGEAGGMLEVHCEDPVILGALTARHLAAGETAPRFHASSRPPYVEAEATVRAVALARAARAPLYVVHLSCAEALAAVREAQTAGLPVFAETCPHYLTLDGSRYDLPAAEAAKYVISPPLRAPGQAEALWAGLADGALALVGTDHVPDRVAVEKQSWHESFDRISNGGPGIETLLTLVHSEGVARGRISLERMVDLLATTPARLFGLRGKGAVEIGRDADLVLFDPAAARVIRQADLHHTSDYTPYEGREVVGAVRSVAVRGAWVVRDGAFVGGRGSGRFVERQLERMA
ncbi:MAG TPA: dihydropyrimidinase, partial [Candidatus Saccharimonadia bacterium]|nr:dihydropyrimidinase [Candidatus Saccharimonadia bacterium]